MSDRERDNTKLDFDQKGVTPEVGDEGGSSGNVQIRRDQGPGTGSEASETWRPSQDDRDTVVRDETGTGRRNP